MKFSKNQKALSVYNIIFIIGCLPLSDMYVFGEK
jgi:hypothetical protein